nr:putative capsid [Picobirnavirus sp.]
MKKSDNSSKSKTNKKGLTEDQVDELRSTRYKGKGKSKVPKDWKEKQSKKHNDVAWYVADKQILNDVARVPFSYPIGYPFMTHGPLLTGNTKDAVAGVLSQGVVPTIGNAKYPGDAVNVAANGMYTFVRHWNSGSRNYDANDLMIYCMAVDSLYYMVSWATRIYATLCLYDQGNKYLPDTLLDAQSINASDFRANMAQFRAGLNLRIPRISTLLVPAVMPIFQRHSWLFQNYYIEGDTIKDQIYFYYPECYYVFKMDSDGAGMLEARFKGSNLTVSQFLNILDEMMDPIIADEDFNIISGDILKAYNGKVLTLDLLPDILIARPVYDETVLLQFKNSTPCDVHRNGNTTGDTYYDGFFNIVQSTNKDYIKVNTPESALLGYRDVNGTHTNHFIGTGGGTELQNQAITASVSVWDADTILCSPHADVSPEEVMVSTRGMMAFTFEQDSTSPYGWKTTNMFFGSEWYCGFNLYHKQINASGTLFTGRSAYERSVVYNCDDDTTPNHSIAIAAMRGSLPRLACFKYHPAVYTPAVYTDTDSSVKIAVAYNPHWDIDNYALLKAETLGRMHDAAIMGEYNVPKIAWSPDK